jgi:hypothetical protein
VAIACSIIKSASRFVSPGLAEFRHYRDLREGVRRGLTPSNADSPLVTVCVRAPARQPRCDVALASCAETDQPTTWMPARHRPNLLVSNDIGRYSNPIPQGQPAPSTVKRWSTASPQLFLIAGKILSRTGNFASRWSVSSSAVIDASEISHTDRSSRHWVAAFEGC